MVGLHATTSLCNTIICSQTGRITLHGFPKATTPEGIFFVTTDPAPMMVSSPIVTLLITIVRLNSKKDA
jgi:hypothetical protein